MTHDGLHLSFTFSLTCPCSTLPVGAVWPRNRVGCALRYRQRHQLRADHVADASVWGAGTAADIPGPYDRGHHPLHGAFHIGESCDLLFHWWVVWPLFSLVSRVTSFFIGESSVNNNNHNHNNKCISNALNPSITIHGRGSKRYTWNITTMHNLI